MKGDLGKIKLEEEGKEEIIKDREYYITSFLSEHLVDNQLKTIEPQFGEQTHILDSQGWLSKEYGPTSFSNWKHTADNNKIEDLVKIFLETLVEGRDVLLKKGFVQTLALRYKFNKENVQPEQVYQYSESIKILTPFYACISSLAVNPESIFRMVYSGWNKTDNKRIGFYPRGTFEWTYESQRVLNFLDKPAYSSCFSAKKRTEITKTIEEKFAPLLKNKFKMENNIAEINSKIEKLEKLIEGAEKNNKPALEAELKIEEEKNSKLSEQKSELEEQANELKDKLLPDCWINIFENVYLSAFGPCDVFLNHSETVEECFRILTGTPTQEVLLDQKSADEIFNLLDENLKQKHAIIVKSKTSAEKNIVQDSFYTILGCYELSNGTKLVKIRHQTTKEFTGDW